MGALEISSFFFFFLLLGFSDLITCQENCQSYERCGASLSEPVIEFPFSLKGGQREGCGYPGFNLTCNSLNRTVLELPYSGQFYVQFIGYYYKVIRLYDPHHCLSRRYLQNLNLSGSPFKGDSYQNYTFLNCSTSVYVSRSPSLVMRIDCLSSSTHEVLATTVTGLLALNTSSCEFIGNVSVPVLLDQSWHLDDNFSALVTLDLTWTSIPPPNPRDDPKGTIGTKIIMAGLSFCIGTPIIILFLCYCFCPGVLNRIAGAWGDHRSLAQSSIADLQILTVTRQPINEAGLIDSIIQSYPKVVLDEKRQLPNPDNTTCSICLSEYRPKETVKVIPACNHCFHANCIDQWLRVNATCPVCRKSPIHLLPQPAHAA